MTKLGSRATSIKSRKGRLQGVKPWGKLSTGSAFGTSRGAKMSGSLNRFLSDLEVVMLNLSRGFEVDAERQLLGPLQDRVEELENGVLEEGEGRTARLRFEEVLSTYKESLWQAHQEAKAVR